jgi:hypothetical protein
MLHLPATQVVKAASTPGRALQSLPQTPQSLLEVFKEVSQPSTAA